MVGDSFYRRAKKERNQINNYTYQIDNLDNTEKNIKLFPAKRATDFEFQNNLYLF